MNQNNIRNFCIIAHIDHGKSTLADRFLELTATVEKRLMHEQYLDTMELEQERGITIKLQPVRMIYKPRTNADHTQTNADNDKSQTNTDKTQTNTDKLLYEELTYRIRGAIFQVRKSLGSGHKEIVYHNALKIEFEKQHIPFESEKVIDVFYDGKKVGIYKPDFIIDGAVLLEIKSLPYIGKPLETQVWNYLKGTLYELALLVNFGPQGAEIRRIINSPIKNSQRQSVLGPSESVYQFNLIDTPGHVDFTYEVSRALAACEGAILLVDATQGIQAQTLANLHLAQAQNLKLIPVINKIDLPNAEPDRVMQEIVAILGFDQKDILKISAKTGEGVAEVLQAIVERVPPPSGDPQALARALVFDSTYDKHRGVVAFVRVVDGAISQAENIFLLGVKKQTHVLELGYFNPEFKKAPMLECGEVGYIVTDFREVAKAKVGDTITTLADKHSQRFSASNPSISVVPLPGYKEVKPVVFASFFPIAGPDYPKLREALEKLKLSDAALSFEPENNPSIGTGFRCGFLGLLHLDIINQRLLREYNLDLVITSPTVAYKVKLRNGKEAPIRAAQEMPDPSYIESMQEPWAKLEVITPSDYLGKVIDLVTKRRGVQNNLEYASSSRVLASFEIPLSNLIVDFYDKLKSLTSGYASLNYELLDWRPADLVKLDILVAGEKVDAFSAILYKGSAEREGREILNKLKELIPKHQFAIALQAVIGGKIIARETIRALRKDVTAGLYGGDDTRKRKVLEKQKKGKKRLKRFGKVSIPQDTFLEVFRK